MARRPFVLVVYKRFSAADGRLAHVRRTRRVHFDTLASVTAEIRRLGFPYTVVPRGAPAPKKFDLLVTVGGDGTLLEASRLVRRQPVLAINSDPAHSVGRFCAANPTTFRRVLADALRGGARLKEVKRLGCRVNGKKIAGPVLNDILVAHANPAAMSHYEITVGKRTEHHRNSGLWISTAAGSSGAIGSAGGRRQTLTDPRFQYRPRELYRGRSAVYCLTGGLLSPRQKLTLRSLMRGGAVYADGAHRSYPFGFGSRLTVVPAGPPLRLVWGGVE